jgi:hypothetical protein
LDDDEGAPPGGPMARRSIDYGHQSLSSDSFGHQALSSDSLDIVGVLNTAGHTAASSMFSGSHPDLLQNVPRASSALLRTASSAAPAADAFSLLTPEIVVAAQARLPDDANAQNALIKLVSVLQSAGGIAQQKQILAELTILNAESEKSKPLMQAIGGGGSIAYQPPFAGISGMSGMSGISGISYHPSPPPQLPIQFSSANIYSAPDFPPPLPPNFRHGRPVGPPAPLFGAFR